MQRSTKKDEELFAAIENYFKVMNEVKDEMQLLADSIKELQNAQRQLAEGEEISDYSAIKMAIIANFKEVQKKESAAIEGIFKASGIDKKMIKKLLLNTDKQSQEPHGEIADVVTNTFYSLVKDLKKSRKWNIKLPSASQVASNAYQYIAKPMQKGGYGIYAGLRVIPAIVLYWASMELMSGVGYAVGGKVTKEKYGDEYHVNPASAFVLAPYFGVRDSYEIANKGIEGLTLSEWNWLIKQHNAVVQAQYKASKAFAEKLGIALDTEGNIVSLNDDGIVGGKMAQQDSNRFKSNGSDSNRGDLNLT